MFFQVVKLVDWGGDAKGSEEKPDAPQTRGNQQSIGIILYSLLNTMRATAPLSAASLSPMGCQLGHFEAETAVCDPIPGLAISFLTPQSFSMSFEYIQAGKPAPARVHFQRGELGLIMSLYGRMVAAGEWRDYGISPLTEVAVFSIFRRTAEYPLYRIEKRPKLKHRQGQYSIVGMDGRILKRGHDLKNVLRVLEKQLIRLVD